MKSETSIKVSRNCPICMEEAAYDSEIAKAKFVAEELDNEKLRDFFVGFRPEQCFFTFVRCNKCGLVFSPTYFNPDAMNQLYSSMPENTSVSGERDSVRTQERYAGLFPNLKQSGGYLELGADIGLLAKKLRDRQNYSFKHAIEPNIDVHLELKENLGSNSQIFVSSKNLPKESQYSHVAAVHVFDHLFEPRKELEKLAGHMTGDSLLLIVVHNEKSTLRYMLRKKWPPFCLQHPQLYNRETITKLLKEEGFDVVKIRRTFNYISISHGLDLLRTIGVLPKDLKLNLPNISVPVPLGNIAVLARKKLPAVN